MLTFLRTRLAALEAWFARRTAWLAHPHAGVVAALVVPLLFGLASIAMGQDDNWDLRNYHVYNAHALLNDRIGYDLAPGRFNTYFNPALDLLYYWLNHWLPLRGAAFAMGVLHGLNFVLLLAIARRLAGAAAGIRLPLLLAAACMFAPAFRGELGNSMGDNSTALLVLGALYLVLSRWETLLDWSAKAALAALCAGLVMGMGAGLKLTNVIYAVAMCLAFLAVPLSFWRRLRLAFLFGLGVLAGVALTGGWWMLKMWQLFGNPLFPQFNNIFRSPWAAQGGISDTHFLPRTLAEYLLWPFVFAADTTRVTEVAVKMAMWPLVYLLFAAGAVALLLRRLHGVAAPAVSSRARFLLCFFGLGYLAWMCLFSIYRYLIPLELLVPLVIWLLCSAIAVEAGAARRLTAVLLVLLLAQSALSVPNWGRAAWAGRAYSAEVPAFARPAQSVVFIAQPEPPMAWLAIHFPPEVKFIGVDAGFPESPAWRQRMRQAVAERHGPHFAILGMAKNEKQGSLENKLAAARWLGLTGDAAGCDKLDWLGRHVRLKVALRRLPSGACTFDLLPEHRVDLAALDRAIVDTTAQHLRRFGIALDAASCQTYPAAVGGEPYPYRLCRVMPAMVEEPLLPST